LAEDVADAAILASVDIDANKEKVK